MRTFLRLLGLLLPFWKDALLAVLLGLAALAAAVGLLGASTDLLSRAALRPSIAELQVAIVGVRFFGLSRAVFRYLERLASHQANLKLLGGIRRRVLRAIYALPAEQLETHTQADLLARTLEDIETLDQFFIRALAPFVTAFAATLGMGFFLGTFAPILGWLVVVGMAAACLMIPALTVRAAARQQGGLTRLRTAYLEDAQEAVELADHWQMFGRQQSRLAQWGCAARGYAAAVASQRSIAAAGEAGAAAAAGLTGLAVLAVAGWLNAQGNIPGTRIAVAAVLAMAVFEAANPVNAAASWLRACLDAGERVLALGRPSAMAAIEAVAGAAVDGSRAKLRIANIEYQYPGAAEPAIRQVDMTLEFGEWLGICGPNGSGKSTLLRLAAGELQSNAGQVDWGGGAALPAACSLLTSRAYLFSASLGANLRLADPGADAARLWQALDWVDLAAWARSLPNGLDTWLGRQGWRLSAGQRQRLALARLYLQDRPLLLLDEPLAHLDVDGGRQMLERMTDWGRTKTVLWVSHDLTIFDRFDRVLVLRSGQVVQAGAPRHLGSTPGWFRSQRDAQKTLEDRG